MSVRLYVNLLIALKHFVPFSGKPFIVSLPTYILELQRTILFNIRYATFLDNFRSSRPEVFLKITVLKHLRKFPRKYPWWSVLVSKIKNNILQRTFY